LLERNLLGTSTNCRVSLPLLVDVEQDFAPIIPKENKKNINDLIQTSKFFVFYWKKIFITKRTKKNIYSIVYI
jgi:hypothetical protein